MLNKVFLLLFLFVFVSILPAHSMGEFGKNKYYAPKIETHFIQSKYVNQIFEIHVMRPISKKDGTERFPVLFAPDADAHFETFRVLSRNLQDTGKAPRYILVGIGYPGDADTSNWGSLRRRDLLMSPKFLQKKISERGPALKVEGYDNLKINNVGSGADKFLKFIRLELMPFVDKNYPTVLDDRSYYGFSGGSFFGFYTLFHQPKTFNRYILGSGIGDHVFPWVNKYIQSGAALNAKLFLSVGGDEQMEGAGSSMISAQGDGLGSQYYRIVKILHNAAIPGLELTARIIPNEIHVTAAGPTFAQGVRSLFGSVDCVPYHFGSDCK